MGFIATLLSMLNSLASLFGLNRPKVEDPGVRVATIANTDSEISAQVAAQTAAETHKDIQHVEDETAAAAARVQSAGSLSDQRDVVQSEIDAANRSPGAN